MRFAYFFWRVRRISLFYIKMSDVRGNISLQIFYADIIVEIVFLIVWIDAKSGRI